MIRESNVWEGGQAPSPDPPMHLLTQLKQECSFTCLLAYSLSYFFTRLSDDKNRSKLIHVSLCSTELYWLTTMLHAYKYRYGLKQSVHTVCTCAPNSQFKFKSGFRPQRMQQTCSQYSTFKYQYQYQYFRFQTSTSSTTTGVRIRSLASNDLLIVACTEYIKDWIK